MRRAQGPPHTGPRSHLRPGSVGMDLRRTSGLPLWAHRLTTQALPCILLLVRSIPHFSMPSQSRHPSLPAPLSAPPPPFPHFPRMPVPTEVKSEHIRGLETYAWVLWTPESSQKSPQDPKDPVARLPSPHLTSSSCTQHSACSLSSEPCLTVPSAATVIPQPRLLQPGCVWFLDRFSLLPASVSSSSQSPLKSYSQGLQTRSSPRVAIHTVPGAGAIGAGPAGTHCLPTTIEPRPSPLAPPRGPYGCPNPL